MRTPYALAVAAALCASTAAHAQLVNIDSRYGFTNSSGSSNPAPVPGEHITLIGSPLVQLVLGPGTYRITNAAGMPGAQFRAWSFNTGTSGWAWAFLMVNDDTKNVIQYFEAGRGSSEAEVAALPGVQNFSDMFTLLTTTTIDFTLRDYYVPDNAGGISVFISPMTNVVPEPASMALLGGGLVVLFTGAYRRRTKALAVS